MILKTRRTMTADAFPDVARLLRRRFSMRGSQRRRRHADLLQPRFPGLGDEFFVEAKGRDGIGGIVGEVTAADRTSPGGLGGYHPRAGPRFDGSNLTGRLMNALFGECSSQPPGSPIMTPNDLSYGCAV